MSTLIQSRPVRTLMFILLTIALVISSLSLWDNYQQEEFLKSLKGASRPRIIPIFKTTHRADERRRIEPPAHRADSWRCEIPFE